MQTPVTRRRFTQDAGMAAAGAVAGSIVMTQAHSTRARAAGESKQSTTYPKGRYVDVHTHLGQRWDGRQVLTAEDLLRWMDAADVSQAVVLPLVSPESYPYPITTQYVLEQTKPHRKRLIPFCSIDPRTNSFLDQKKTEAMLRRYASAGAKGFGEHKPGVAIDDPRNIRLLAACAEVQLPVLFHLDNLRNTDRPGLPGLEKVLKELPSLVMIGHGPGFWASISRDATQASLGGYPKGRVAPGGALDRLMEKYANLYGDLSAGSGANAVARDPEFGRAFLIRRADRLMFGTDFLSHRQNIPQLDLYGNIDLPEAVQKKIFRDNARRVIGM